METLLSILLLLLVFIIFYFFLWCNLNNSCFLLLFLICKLLAAIEQFRFLLFPSRYYFYLFFEALTATGYFLFEFLFILYMEIGLNIFDIDNWRIFVKYVFRVIVIVVISFGGLYFHQLRKIYLNF